MQTTSQTILNRIKNPVRLFAAGTWLGLFTALTLCLCVVPANAGSSTAPIVVTGPTTLIGNLNFNGAGGGWFSGQAPLGGTLVVGANGDVIVGDGYGGTSGKSGVFQITPAGVQTMLANFTNSNAAGMDKYGNVYVGRDYGDTFIKLPFVAGQYVGYTGSTPTTNCQGGTSDTQPCIFAPGTKAVIDAGATAGGGNAGFTSLFFDGQGNFFFATDTNPGSKGNANTIYECSTQCQAETDGNGTYPPVVVYADSNAALGSVAVDPWGNLFFSDGQSSSNKGNITYVEELPFSSGKYAATPTQLTSYTSAAGYNAIGGVSASNLGVVYFSIPNDGVYAIPNSSSGPNAAGMYKVSNEGGKGLTLDTAGNLYVVNYSNANSADSIWVTAMGNIGFGASPVGTATAGTAVTVFDMAGNCTSAPTLTFATTGSDYSPTVPAASSCGSALNSGSGAFTPAPASSGAVYSSTIIFTPSKAGARVSLLEISDAANSASGMTALYGVGQGAAVNVDPGVATAFTTGLTNPASIVGDSAGDVFIADSGAGKVYEIANGTSTLTSIGSGFKTPDSIVKDPNGDLFIADDGNLTVTEIPNTGTPGTFTAGTQTTVVATTAIFGSEALGSATGLAFGPQGTLYISDPQNNRVVYYNVITGQSGVTLANKSTGLSSPMGLAVDSSSNLYVADSGLNGVVELSAGVVSAPITSSSISEAIGVAVDGSGSLLIADGASGNIVRVPNVSGTLTTSDAVTVETLASPASSLWSDGSGNLFVAGGSAKSAWVINRSAVSINLGTVADGATGSGAIYLSVSGNETATLPTPDLTQPTNTMFLLAPAATNGCNPGSGPAGALCAFTATFAPPAGSGDSGPYSDNTGAILVSIPLQSIPVTISGTASVSSLQPQTITYSPAPPTSGLIGQQITLSATATSGLAVTFSSPTPSVCTSTGATVVFTAAGTCTIDANQAGGTNNGKVWGAAPQVITSIKVTSATPTGVPGLVMNQLTWLNPTGSFTDGQTPQGGSFAVTQDGEVVVGTTYSNKVYFVNAQTGATITTVKVNGPGGITVDSKNNLYISHLYSNVIYKIPFVNGAYVSWTDGPTPAPAACTGSDTAECTFVTYPSTPTPPNSGGLKAIAFDPSGNFYMVTEPDSSKTGTGASYIYECGSSCQPAGTGSVLYADTNGVSQIAFDPWGNLFFTDANYLESGANNEGNSGATSTGLYEIPATALATPPFTGTPTAIQTFANTGTPGGYDDMLASVTVSPTTGTIYYGVLYDGLFAIPNTQSGGPQVNDQYAASTQGAKALQADANGNLYMVANTSGSDTVGFLAIGDMTTPNAQYQGAPVMASANVVDNAIGYCPKTNVPNLLFTASNPTEFAATASSTCAGIGMGDATLKYPLNGTYGSASSYTATITFTPLSPNSQTSTLAISDVANGGTGTATVTGFSETTPQTITFTAPTTTTYTYTAPPSPVTITVSVANGGSNNPVVFSVDSKSTGNGSFSATTVSGTTSSTTLTVTQAGTIIIDANEAGGLVSSVYYNSAPQVQLPLTINQASQTITFTPITGSPFTYAAAPNQVTIQLSATGGASGNPVTFSVDASSTGAGTISGTTTVGTASLATLTITQAGSIVIDAAQAATTNYAAASLSDAQTIQVNQAAQTITFIPPAQPIHFITASTGITGGITVQVSATGGASDNAIVFTVDKSSTMAGSFGASTVSGATSTAVLTIPIQGSLTSGNIVIDATQAASTDYAAASATPLGTITILAPLPLQTITWGNPGTQVAGGTLALTGTASSAFPITYTSTATSVCTVSGTTATFVAAGSCTITATQPGDNVHFAAASPVSQTFTVNAKGQNPAVALNLSLSSLTLQPGTVGTSTITITSQNNFTGAVVFSCSGLPSGYACSFTPAASSTSPLILQPNQATSVTVALTPTGSASLERGPRPFAPLATLAAALILIGFRKRNRIFLVLLITLSAVGLGLFTGCGGSSSAATTASTTSSVTVTATASGMSGASGSVTQSATLSVTVE